MSEPIRLGQLQAIRFGPYPVIVGMVSLDQANLTPFSPEWNVIDHHYAGHLIPLTLADCPSCEAGIPIGDLS